MTVTNVRHDNKTVTIEVEVDDELLTVLSRAIALGITTAFRQHRKRVDQGILNDVIGEANSAALHYLFETLRPPEHIEDEDGG